MPRSLKKGPYIHPSILKHMGRISSNSKTVIKIWSRASTITPEMIGYSFGIHNGKNFIEIKVMEDMVGHHFGEFAPTRKFVRHGGKMQRDMEQKSVATSSASAGAKAPAKK